jgi:hypothetical protein
VNFISVSLLYFQSISMALQPFVRPWPLFQFFNLYTVGRTPWTGDQPVARPLPKHRLNAQSMPRVGLETTTPVFERAKTVHALDRAAGHYDRPSLKMLVSASGCAVPNGIMNMHDSGWMRIKAVLLKGSGTHEIP